jgi:putative ABC transport system permease protein
LLSLFLAAVFSVAALSAGPRWLSFGAAFLVLAGFSFLVPRLMFHFSKGAGRVLRLVRPHRRKAAIEAELAAANLSRALLRNSVTVAALAVAVAMTVGVSVMVFSFRKTVEAWINDTLIADLFVTPASNEVGANSFMPPAALQFFSNHPAVETVDTFREVDLPMGDGNITLAVIRGSERRHFQFLRGDNSALMRRFHDEACVFASESFARRHRLLEGDAIELTTPGGARKFPIAGIFYDYTRDQGIVYMSAKNFSRFWHDDRVNSIAVYVKKDRDAEEVSTAFRAWFTRTSRCAGASSRSSIRLSRSRMSCSLSPSLSPSPAFFCR